MADIHEVLGDYILGPAHIGFVVTDLDAAVSDAQRLYGFSPSSVRYEPAPGVVAPTRFAFFQVGGIEFEYIQPCSEEFTRQLFSSASGGGGINHVAWRVSDIDAAVEALAEQGITPGYVTPGGIIAIGSKKMVYLDPDSTSGLLVELIQYPEEGADRV